MLSTLRFMSRAKCIRNRATVNLDARGDVVLLQRKIVRLNTELNNLCKSYTEPAIQESKELRVKLEEMAAAKGQMEVLMLSLEKENQNLKAERRQLEHKMAQIQKYVQAILMSATLICVVHPASATVYVQSIATTRRM